MARISTASRETVSRDQLETYNECMAARGSIPNAGPVSVMVPFPN